MFIANFIRNLWIYTFTALSTTSLLIFLPLRLKRSLILISTKIIQFHGRCLAKFLWYFIHDALWKSSQLATIGFWPQVAQGTTGIHDRLANAFDRKSNRQGSIPGPDRVRGCQPLRFNTYADLSVLVSPSRVQHVLRSLRTLKTPYPPFDNS